jgi:preprotein translocase subunit SecF
MVGIIAGVVSSVLLATPLMVDLKTRNAKYREHTAKVYRRREKAAAGSADGFGAAAVAGPEAAGSEGQESVSREPDAETVTTTVGGSGRGGQEQSGSGQRSAKSPSGKSSSAKSRPSGKSQRPSGKKRR